MLAALKREEKPITMIVDQERVSAQRSKDAMVKEAALKAVVSGGGGVSG